MLVVGCKLCLSTGHGENMQSKKKETRPHDDRSQSSMGVAPVGKSRHLANSAVDYRACLIAAVLCFCTYNVDSQDSDDDHLHNVRHIAVVGRKL